MFDFDSLEPHIRTILSAPGVDLKTVSAKRVRKELIGREPELTADFIKENKSEIDAVIGRVFEQVNPPDQESEVEEEPEEEVKPAEKPSRKRKHSGEDEDEGTEGQTGDDDEEEEEEEEKPKPKKKKKKASSSTMSDAELARKLSGEINGRARRTKARNASPRKQKKSAATVDSDDEDGEEGGKKKKRKASGGGAKGGFAKEFALSEPLSAVLNEQKLSRPQVVKQLWVYIKANELQNPSNKREIVCDDALRRVFNTDKIDMFKMNKELGSHLYDAANS
ncbi:SWIB-domain-containing protein [Schizophyllum commune H4-8]|uniref:DM2 domain-containing protein n=1 Tax=Schizophyllum commune (strain H4-8 / FGSC 9210) TaxID=578458 RepID=D8Q9T0_SCHCM|nr:SWIB-domain-containing protein [Schizophyllum commune H4-8]KAI5890298.1 SWIB-domain-containing protein [Schizophyllum commune H4-8]